jgi:hypothetical protein
MQTESLNSVLASATLAATLAFVDPAISRRIARRLNSSGPEKKRVDAPPRRDGSTLLWLALLASLLIGLAACDGSVVGSFYDLAAAAPGLI